MAAPGAALVGTATSDVALVEAARAGDDAAFEELYRRYHARVSGYVRGIVRDPSRAEDVAQDAFISALRRMRETDREIAFKPWIFEIARNASIDVWRRASRAEEVSIDYELGARDVARLPGAAGPDVSLFQKQRFEHLRGALDELSDTHHRIIVLREMEGLSYREIAERMELTPAAVESALFRARRRLQHEYAQLDTGRRCRSIAALIGRLAEGLESEPDRRRLHRHARRCSSCRRRARQLGVEPIQPARSLAARVAGLLPLPAVARRRLVGGEAATGGTASTAHNTLAQAGIALGPAVEATTTLAGKAMAALVAIVLVSGGSATFHEKGVPAQDGAGGAATVLRAGQVPLASGLARDLRTGILRTFSPRTGARHRRPAPRRRPEAPTAGGAAGAPAGLPSVPELPVLPGVSSGPNTGTPPQPTGDVRIPAPPAPPAAPAIGATAPAHPGVPPDPVGTIRGVASGIGLTSQS